MKYIDLLRDARIKLKNEAINTAEIDSELILSKSINLNRENILLNLNSIASQNQIKIFFNKINKRLNKEPIAYILEQKEFWSRDFKVNRHTLIPRPETELMIEKLIQIFKNKSISILDVGTGSGCILISLVSELKNASGVGIDV